MSVQAPRRLFTVDEFHQMAEAGIFHEDDRIELLSGEIVEMTPIGSRHAACVSRLNRLLGQTLGETHIVRVQDPLRLDDYSEPQPDLAVVRARADFYRDAHPGPTDVLLVIEIAETSAEIDRTDKVPRYGQSGVPEVWVVDQRRSDRCVPRPKGRRLSRARDGAAERVAPTAKLPTDRDLCP